MRLEAGHRLGPYEVDGFIATGGMGEVYRARDTRLNRPVALKVLAQSVTTDADGLARFAQEARTTALLNHPNIVAVYDVGVASGHAVRRLGTARRQDAARALKHGALPVRTAIAYALEIARGLIAAHDLDVVHRDLKPENIFITRDDRVKILDFGLAKCRNATLGLPARDSANSTTPGAAARDGRLHVAGTGARRRRRSTGPTSSASASCCTR